jgi:hypothetical protein
MAAGEDLDSRVFFRCIPGLPMADKIAVWLKMGRDEDYVMNSEPPCNSSVVETTY